MTQRHVSHNRSYRESITSGPGEVIFRTGVEQTDLLILARRDMSREVADYLHQARGEIKNYADLHPEFLHGLDPVAVPEGVSELVWIMAEAGRACGVGPMAAVAGTLAQAVADRFAQESPDIIVENGGDVYMHSTRERVAALLADPESGAGLGLRLTPDDFPLSLCSSSATIGHSLSLGHGDLVTVRSKSGAFADAAATALCNILNTEKDLAPLLKRAEQLAPLGLDGIFAQIGGKAGVWGNMELVALSG